MSSLYVTGYTEMVASPLTALPYVYLKRARQTVGDEKNFSAEGFFF